ncbi:MAG: sulfotransferase domain-containing protein [Dokdonella sp.]
MGNIVWLASYPKSGNTWLRAFLANLVANRSEPVPINDLPRYADDEARPDLFGAMAGRPSSELTFEQISQLRPRVHAEIAARTSGTRFVKTHNMAGSVDDHPLHNWDVTVGAITVVRNPLDVAVSMTHHFGIDLDTAIERLGNEHVATANDALFVTQVIGSWSMHVKSWADFDRERFLLLRYEDLVEKPVKAFTRIARLIGAGHDRERIQRAIGHARFRTLASMEKSGGFIEARDRGTRFFRKGQVNEWREALSREQVARVIAAHRVQMARFGYVPAGM